MKWIRSIAVAGALGFAVWFAVRPTTTAPGARASAPPTTLTVDGRASTAPSIAADGDTVAVAWGGTRADGAADVFVALSRNAGRTFGEPVRASDLEGTARISGEMAPRVTVTARAGQPALVSVLWTATGAATAIRLARSGDGGQTFTPSQALQTADAAGDRGWAALARGPDGRSRAVWLDHRGLAPISTSAAGHHHGHDTESSSSEDGTAMARKSAIYFSDGAVERAVAHGVCYCCKTALTVAADGRVLTAWRHVYPGNLRDIAFAMSSNDGLSFSDPIRVSQDEWQIDGCPDDGPALALGPDGMIHLTWPTVVSRPAPHKAMFYASSRDGKHFTPRIRVSPEGRSIAHPQMAVAPDGAVATLWDEIVDGRRRVFLARLIDGAFTEPEAISREPVAYYPIAVFSGGALVVVWTEGSAETSRIAVTRIP